MNVLLIINMKKSNF